MKLTLFTICSRTARLSPVSPVPLLVETLGVPVEAVLEATVADAKSTFPTFVAHSAMCRGRFLY